ncbi:TPA: DNA adenine methylase [Enterobacter cloacae]|jgi:DNA adenine methylase|uniref:DNA adenine methylase n=1 Tax=Enterobacter cloacae complex TaxID=354276 RepID=UPI0009C2A7C6|nr:MULTISPECIES: DNA adenine methylase [Enterobacter cloacae complex]EKS9202529.1 DNA adenine methylase [Enterobacter cloacae]AQT90883.1 DNA methyltransferase [Enterobacter roggenkampii]EKV5785055.1 DNA adenine methylase [Enterobacter cloacae]UER62337.1 DNA adenine methylase [Enterobacter roggenkampii]HEC5273766.1 DNA adenine methylase [Enterobacter cloacae]
MNYSPLRYPGGKSKLSPHIKEIIRKNDLEGCQYIEPYAGGAGVALCLLLEGWVSTVHINDADIAVYSFWKSLVDHPDELLNFIDNVKVTMDTWHEKKYILENASLFQTMELGFATFFLNRTNRSGILKGGVIGGKEQNGNYKLDARFNKTNLLERIKKIADRADQIIVSNCDASSLLSEIKNKEVEDVIVYLDPPYYVKGQGLYRNYYNHEDHLNIMDVLSSSNFKWIVSYDNNEEIKKMYADFRQVEYSLKYSAQFKSVGKEVIIYSNNLLLPK